MDLSDRPVRVPGGHAPSEAPHESQFRHFVPQLIYFSSNSALTTKNITLTNKRVCHNKMRTNVFGF